MTHTRDELDRLSGILLTLDGPGGVGKSTPASLIAELLRDAGMAVHATAQPSRATLGEVARHGTDTYHGMALACLCAADRHHQLEVEILPALRGGQVVVCDRYVASSLVLQGLDGLPADLVWHLNRGVYRPDLAVILNADPEVIAARLHRRGTHSRFERDARGSERESAAYRRATGHLLDMGWPAVPLDATTDEPATIAATIASLVRRTAREKELACH